jgi:hypothetical protein
MITFNGKRLHQMKPRSMMVTIIMFGFVAIGIGTLLHTTSGKNTQTLHAKNTASVTTTTSSFAIPQMGVNLTIPSDLSAAGLVYEAQLNRPVTAADEHPWATISFTSNALLALDSSCTADEAPLGMLVRYTEDPTSIHADVRASLQLGSYYYGFATSPAPCSNNPAAEQLQLQETAELEQSFNSLKDGS